jgi:hypothetical protein
MDEATIEDTVRFLDALAPDGQRTFQTFADAKRDTRLNRILHGDYRWRARVLRGLNAKGAGVFVMVNRGDDAGRRASNVTDVRAVFVDLDGAPLAPVLAAPIRPAIVCESSPDRFHAYWPVTGLPLTDFKHAQQALALRFNADPKVSDLARVMRLPGYIHAKRQPFTSRLLHCDRIEPYHWHNLADAFGLQHVKPRGADALPPEIHQGDRNTRMFAFACGLRRQGLSEPDARARVQTANASYCKPPMDGAEVATIVANAWGCEAQGFVKLPYSLLDCDAFRALPDTGKVAILALSRAYSGSNNRRIALTRSEAKSWGMTRYKRTTGLRAAEASGLIECTERGMSAAPGRRATPDRFRLLWIDG